VYKFKSIRKEKKGIDSRLSAYGHNNSRHCWEMLVWQMLDGVGSDVQADARLLATMKGHVEYYRKDSKQKTS